VRAAAQSEFAVIEKIGMIFVRVMPDTAPNASQDFMRIVTRAARSGSWSAEAINPLGSDQLCFGKDAAGAWKIVGNDRRRMSRLELIVAKDRRRRSSPPRS